MCAWVMLFTHLISSNVFEGCVGVRGVCVKGSYFGNQKNHATSFPDIAVTYNFHFVLLCKYFIEKYNACVVTSLHHAFLNAKILLSGLIKKDFIFLLCRLFFHM